MVKMVIPTDISATAIPRPTSDLKKILTLLPPVPILVLALLYP